MLKNESKPPKPFELVGVKNSGSFQKTVCLNVQLPSQLLKDIYLSEPGQLVVSAGNLAGALPTNAG
jgi:hypothetical protein